MIVVVDRNRVGVSYWCTPAIDIRELCGGQIEIEPWFPASAEFDVYLVDEATEQSDWSVTVGEQWRQCWADAAEEYLSEVTRALRELAWAHGRRGAVADLRTGAVAPGSPRWLMSRRPASRRTIHAQQRFVAAVTLARAQYEPVAAQIEECLKARTSQLHRAGLATEASTRTRFVSLDAGDLLAGGRRGGWRTWCRQLGYYPADPGHGASLGWWAEEVTGTEHELARWRAAAERYWRAVAAAYAELAPAYGESLTVDPLGRRSGGTWAPPWGWLRRRQAEWRRAANERFLTRTTVAGAAYERIRGTVEQRYQVAARQREARERNQQQQERAERVAAERQRRAEADRRRRAFEKVASQRVWRYVLDDEAKTVHLYRDDVPPSAAPAAAAAAETLPASAAGSYKASALADQLKPFFRRGRDRYTAHWDPAAQAAVVAELAQRDVAASFDDWWQAVVRRRWTPPQARRGPGATSGSSSYTGYSEGGSSGAGASFGTPTF